MKICYIISDIDKAVYFEQTALALRNNGLDVAYILINCTNKHLHLFLTENGFDVFTIEAGSLIKSRKAIQECKAILKQRTPEIVHCHLAQANWIGLWAARLAKIPTRVYTRHSGEPLQLNWKEKVIDRIQNRLATRIISISKNIDDLLKKQGVDEKKRCIIHHGFQIERFANPNSQEVSRMNQVYNQNQHTPVIGVIARWMEWKGIHYVIKAFERFTNEYPDAQLYLFGASEKGDYSSEITQLLSRLPKKNIQTVSFEENVFDLYQLFDVYVHVPINANCEAFGQTYVEALAAGVPSVFTLSGVAREFIQHEKNALVVPFENSQAIYEAMLRLMNEPELAYSLQKNGQQDVKRLFKFDTYIQKLIELYQKNE